MWIVGASQGLGEVLARRLAEQGARLILSSRNEAKLLVGGQEGGSDKDHWGGQPLGWRAGTIDNGL